MKHLLIESPVQVLLAAKIIKSAADINKLPIEAGRAAVRISNVLASVDPSSDKSYLTWLAKMYVQGDLALPGYSDSINPIYLLDNRNDLNQLKIDLSKFISTRRGNISELRSISELKSVTQSVDVNDTSGTTEIYKDGEYKVIFLDHRLVHGGYLAVNEKAADAQATKLSSLSDEYSRKYKILDQMGITKQFNLSSLLMPILRKRKSLGDLYLIINKSDTVVAVVSKGSAMSGYKAQTPRPRRYGYSGDYRKGAMARFKNEIEQSFMRKLKGSSDAGNQMDILYKAEWLPIIPPSVTNAIVENDVEVTIKRNNQALEYLESEDENLTKARISYMSDTDGENLPTSRDSNSEIATGAPSDQTRFTATQYQDIVSNVRKGTDDDKYIITKQGNVIVFSSIELKYSGGERLFYARKAGVPVIPPRFKVRLAVNPYLVLVNPRRIVEGTVNNEDFRDTISMPLGRAFVLNTENEIVPVTARMALSKSNYQKLSYEGFENPTSTSDPADRIYHSVLAEMTYPGIVLGNDTEITMYDQELYIYNENASYAARLKNIADVREMYKKWSSLKPLCELKDELLGSNYQDWREPNTLLQNAFRKTFTKARSLEMMANDVNNNDPRIKLILERDILQSSNSPTDFITVSVGYGTFGDWVRYDGYKPFNFIHEMVQMIITRR